MNAYFIRHGQTNYNLEGLCNDDPADDVHLTALGRRQAERAAGRLRRAALEHIFVSPLPRTRETAAIVNRHHHVPITVHPDLRDIRSGFNNRPVREYQAAIAHDPLNAGINGGESLRQHKARVLRFVDWLGRRPERTVLVVAHEETMRVFAAHFRDLDDEAMRGLSFANGELVRFELRRDPGGAIS